MLLLMLTAETIIICVEGKMLKFGEFKWLNNSRPYFCSEVKSQDGSVTLWQEITGWHSLKSAQKA